MFLKNNKKIIHEIRNSIKSFPLLSYSTIAIKKRKLSVSINFTNEQTQLKNRQFMEIMALFNPIWQTFVFFTYHTNKNVFVDSTFVP